MSTSKNDFPIAGYYGRKKVHYNSGRTKSKCEVIYMLKNPATTKPYTLAEILADLEKRRREYPALALLLEPWIDELTPRAQENPDAYYAIYCSDSTEELAHTRFKKIHWNTLEALAQLLYRPLYERNLKCGDMTVNDFVAYQAETLYSEETPDLRIRLMGYLKRVILPVIGNKKLNSLDSNCQKKALQTIKKKLENGIEPAGKSTCGYIKRAYQGLLLAIESSGWKGCSAGMDLVNMLRSSSDQNNYIRKGYRINHLDDDQRNALFTLLMQPEYLYDLFLVALFYSGLDEADIAGQTYGDFEVLTLKDGCCCYTLMINRRVRKLNERYSTLQATNKSFPIQKLRRIVLAPWAGEILLKRLEQLRSFGFTDEQIKEMRLSSETPGSAIVGPAELANRLQPLLKQAGIRDATSIRTDKKGGAHREIIKEDIQLLLRDSRYLAERCGADDIMMHAMFGEGWTETDEKSYLDLLGDQYAVARYQRLRRWSPFAPTPLPEAGEEYLTGYTHMPARHIIQVNNTSDHPSTLSLYALYGFNAYWGHNRKERNTS